MRNYRIVNRSFEKDTEKIQTERNFDGYGSGVGFTRSRFESLFSIPASSRQKNGKNGNRHDQGCSRAAAVELPRGSPDEPEQADDNQKSKHSHTSFLIFEYKKHPAIRSTAECYLWSRFPFMRVPSTLIFYLLLIFNCNVYPRKALM